MRDESTRFPRLTLKRFPRIDSFAMMNDPPSQALHVIHKMGGINAAARLLGHANPSTVQGWRKSGFIPPRRHAEVLGKARAAGIDLRPEDFIVHLVPVMQPHLER